MPPAVKKPKKKKKRPEQSASCKALIKLLPQIRVAERECRLRCTITGYEISRSTSENKSLKDCLDELKALEESAIELIERLEVGEVGEVTVHLATLVADAGSSGFLGSINQERRSAGPRLTLAARRALSRKEPDEEEGDDDDVSESTISPKEGDNSRTELRAAAGEADGSGGSGDEYTVDRLIASFCEAGYLALCFQLWRPARDGDHEALAKLLALEPYTIDEPGRAAHRYTNALQVACAAGHVQCVELLVKHGAIFRDADWQQPPRPFVCVSMLTGAGYFDQGGAPRGILYFQSGSLPKRCAARAPRARLARDPVSWKPTLQSPTPCASAHGAGAWDGGWRS